MARLGVFGGAFNPIHHGHVAAARAAMSALRLDRLLFIPTGVSPLKADAELADGAHRIEMARLAIAGEPGMAVSDVEVTRPGKSFALDTVRALRTANPDVTEMLFLIGADVARRLNLWKGIDELRTLARFVVLSRAGDVAAGFEPGLERVETPSIDISSTEIRDRIRRGMNVESMIARSVAAHIDTHRLYRTGARGRITRALDMIRPRVVACSGGIDSLLLATLAHRQAPDATIIAHAISPAVPEEATQRVRDRAATEGWALRIIRSGEFDDERYLSNPLNRCYFCKSNLYEALKIVAATLDAGAVLLSGANIDDLGEYRPGLEAAAERGVRHPWIEAGLHKSDIRAIATDLGLPFASLPASPCLASRLYTGTRVTTDRLQAIERGEALLRRKTGIDVVRCRIRSDELIIEVGDADRARITDPLIERVLAVARATEPALRRASLDARAYRPGRAFVGAP